MIELKFEKLYNRDRISQPCFVSVPLASGVLQNQSYVTIWQNGKERPVQTKVLSRYPDGSVRYLLVRFLADIPANRAATVELEFSDGDRKQQYMETDGKKEKEASGYAADIEARAGKSESMSGMVRCCPLEEGYQVSTGTLEFIVKNSSLGLFEQVCAFGKKYDREQFSNSVITSEEGKQYHLRYGDWKVVEEGPVCVILSNQGRMVLKNEKAETEMETQVSGGSEILQPIAGEFGIQCETRVTVYAGKQYAEVEQRLINATEQEFSMHSWEFVVDMQDKTEVGCLRSKEENGEPGGRAAKIRTCVAESNYKTNFLVSEDGEAVEKSITAEFLLNQSNEHFAETFYGTFFADYTGVDGGICATIYQAHQNYPKAVLASREGLMLKLLPEGCAPAVLQSGMAIKQSFQLLFHSAEEDLQEINHQSIMYQMPDRPIVPVRVYEESGLFPDVFVEKQRQSIDVECALIASADTHTRSYGMLHWGDAPDPGYTAQGRGKGRQVWTNNEYDYPHACMIQYVRTGLRRFFDYCVVAGTHQRDVDICHYSKNPLLQDGQWEHTAGHCEDGVVACSHQWVEGLFDCYHLTGDDRFYEAALGIGGNVLRLLDTPEYQKTGGMSARETGWALRTLVALYQETFDKKWMEKSDWIVGQFKEWREAYGGWLAPYTDNTVIRVPFMISVAVGSLMRYYREVPREDVKELLVAAVEDMVENCITEFGYFYYKELPSLGRIGNNTLILEALAIAYELTGEKKFLECGMRTFQTVVQNSLSLGGGNGKRVAETAVLVGNTGTKRFAQMLVPVLTFYKAVSDCGMLEL